MKYICTICGYIYDEAEQETKFEDLPESWTCPLCGAPKSAFKLIEEESKTPQENIIQEEENEEDMQELSYGEFSIICSNLARGCEKQYKFEEEKMFKEIAKYFENITKKEETNINNLSNLLENDINTKFDKANKVADSYADRGTKRALTWSEKVTRMNYSLLNTYKEQGKEMFKDKQIWICTVCGFIYVGKELPTRCPVCKVPNSKFMKVERRGQI